MITIEWLFSNLDFFGNGFDQTSILLALCLIDLAFGISARLYQNKSLQSHKFLAGIIHNFVPSLIPSLITVSEFATKHFITMYAITSILLFFLIAYFLIQSILANAVILGLDVKWIKKWVDSEIAHKTKGGK